MTDNNQATKARVPPVLTPRILPVFAALNHIVSSVGHNWKVGARHGLPWLALITLFKIWSLWKSPIDSVAFTLPDALALAVGLVATSSIAVSWHRYILQDEPPATVPPFRMDAPVWHYLWRTCFITIICLGPILGVALLSDIVPALLPLWIALSLLLIVTLVRLSVGLVATALNKPEFSLKTAWEATRGNMTRVLGLLVLVAILEVMLLIALVMPMAATLPNPPSWMMPATVLASIPIQLAAILLNTSLLTSLYGFFVERRNF